VPDAFFSPLALDRFQATELTRGPWDPALQHAGPPAALLGRAVEAHGDRAGLRVARITFEIVRPVPIAELTVATRSLRGGRSIELVEATLSAGETEVMRATGLRIRSAPDLDLPARLAPGPRLPGPAAGRVEPFFPTGQEVGYHTAMEFRFVAGSFLEPGPATVWMRMRHPVVPDEPPSPLSRVLQRRQRRPRLPYLAVHQPRPDGLPPAVPRRRVGRPGGVHHRRRRHRPRRHHLARRAGADRQVGPGVVRRPPLGRL
jgi:hypothetical protein